mgnify:CR=1 FL=1
MLFSAKNFLKIGPLFESSDKNIFSRQKTETATCNCLVFAPPLDQKSGPMTEDSPTFLVGTCKID